MRNIKIEFHHDRYRRTFTMPGADVERDFTAVTVTCEAGTFLAKVVRDSRDQPNRRIARMKALEKAITPLPRAQRIEVWTAWNNRNRSNRNANSAPLTSGSRIMTSESIQTLDTTTLGIT